MFTGKLARHAFGDRFIEPLFAITLGALMLMAAIAVAGVPRVFFDTALYWNSGKLQFAALHGFISGWRTPTGAWAGIADRSLWYGCMLLPLQKLGTLWLVAVLQSFAATFAIYTLWKSVIPQAQFKYWFALMALLSATTSLPYFAGFAMPDVWLGIGLVALVALSASDRNTPVMSRLLLMALLAGGLAFHRSNLPALIGGGAVGFFTLKALGIDPRVATPGRFASIGVIVATLVLTTAQIDVIGHVTKEPVRTVPFLTARILADGPGREYLRHACHTGGQWHACRIADTPMTDPSDILWSTDPKQNIFDQTQTGQQTSALIKEEPSFVTHALLYDPFRELHAAEANFIRQLTMIYTVEPIDNPSVIFRQHIFLGGILSVFESRMGCGIDGNRCQTRISAQAVDDLNIGSFVASMGVIIWIMSRKAFRETLIRKDVASGLAVAATALCISSMIINAAVTGVLSGPYPRYGARISWLMVLSASIFLGRYLYIVRPIRMFNSDRFPFRKTVSSHRQLIIS